jgi:hypothetical protein
MLTWTATASAQLDPLLFIKRVPPTVIIVVDTSLQMLEDGDGYFYDPNVYSTTADPAVMDAFPEIDPSTTSYYQRRFRNLVYDVSPGRYSADRIFASPATGTPATDAAFLHPTRWSIAGRGIAAAVGENASSAFRWGLIRLRQKTPAWRTSPNCDKPVRLADASQSAYGDATPCTTGSGKFGIYAPSVAAASFAQAAAPAGTVMVQAAAGTAATVLDIATKGAGDNAGLIPAGLGDVGYADRPIDFALLDAKAEAVRAMTADAAATRTCRNTIVILITGGKDDGNPIYNAAHDPIATANSFRTVVGGGVTRRVPIHVIGVKPAPADEGEMLAIANASTGHYMRATRPEEVANAINYAVQRGFARSNDVEAWRDSEFIPVSPIVGTVNLKNARDKNGVLLPNTEIRINDDSTGQILPQRSNMMVTAGFKLPGFDGRIRAIRSFKPVRDTTKPAGWKFVNDNTALWPALEGDAQRAGVARTPLDPAKRNIYTYVPDGSGGGSVVAFTTANAAQLAAGLNVGPDPAPLISWVRAMPLGAVIGSTPALMDPPSLDPPPDDEYGQTGGTGTFAGDHTKRRSMIFVGANDGMIHAIDARTGYEVWAFIPYNLLPKLRTLVDGQPIEQFDYFVDSSPKIAEVKIEGEWRSLLIIGQGQGGTFYQAFDVTKAGMGVDPELGDLSAVNSLLQQFDTPNESIEFKWAFPNYSSFDPTYAASLAVADATPGGRVKFFGDLKTTATHAEKTVGFTWSDPAVGPLDQDRTVNAVIVGSGYFPALEALLPGRGAAAPKAGDTLYLINADTGELVGNSTGNACTGTGCLTVGDVANTRKNALQADPTAASDSGSHVVNKAYLGDIDGKYWRFNFNGTGAITKLQMIDTSQPIYASSALLFVGTQNVYMFFSTGSDLLPTQPAAAGGTGTFKLFGLRDNGLAAATQMFAYSLAAVTNSNGLAKGERPSTAPSVAGDIVFFTTTTEDFGAPCVDYTSSLYGFTYTGGAAYDASGNGKIDNNESRVARTMLGRATAPFIVDQHLYVATTGGGTTGGAAVESFGDPEDYNNGVGQVGVRILSWREIR